MIGDLKKAIRRAVLLVVILLGALKSEATHIFGIDLYYTWVSGNTYTVHLVIYGDCSGSAFGTFPTSVPVINIYDGNTFNSSINLAIQAPATGVEVTPVCPADIGHTTCTSLSNPISGVKKFVYNGNVTLPYTSTVWRFLFQGTLGSTSAGRSNSITNVFSGTTIQLVDTLNNTTFNNSSAVYTTIPTPFYCLSIPANFNPGAVDPNGDSLAYSLVPGIDATSGSSVTYISPYTATAPLGVSPGTFSFNSTTGQLTFTPNILQKALVVYNVEEFRSGVLRGTSQREMTVVVISPCSNIPPNGVISSASAGTVTGGTNISLCQSVGPFNFHINPTDPGGGNITMVVSGLPAGATFNIVNNGTLAPLGTFTWNTTGIAPGNYTFFIHYTDDGCPLSGEQTIAYTVTILPVPTELYALVSPATCPAKAVFHVTPGGSASPWVMTVIQGGITIQTISGVTGMVTDSLVPGTYTIRMTNTSGCSKDTVITITSPPLPVPTVTTAPPLCPGGATGSATIIASSGLAPYLYAIGTGTYGASGTFTGLTPGSYVLHIKDANNCIKDTVITVPNAVPILLNISIRRPLCSGFANGSVTINAYNSIAPYTYAMGTGTFSTTNVFNALAAGTYVFHIKNANGCQVDTTLILVDSAYLHASIAISPILCNAGMGTITMTGIGGYVPYNFAYNTNPFSTTNSFNLSAGTYTMHIKDVNLCSFDTVVVLTQPTPITVTATHTNVLCHGAASGTITLAATGGTPGYQYNMDGGIYGASATFTGLSAGTHIGGVIDVNNCNVTYSVTVTEPTAMQIDYVVMHQPLCFGGADGSLTIYGSGGLSPYTYALGGGTYGIPSVFNTLTTGSYVLHVKDVNGCTKDTTVTLLQPSGITPSAVVKKSICATLGNGKVTLSGSGGTPGYTYAVGSGAYGASGIFTPLAAGTYTFHIKDANLCVKDTTFTITDSLIVSAIFTITPALCNNQASGIIDVSGTGGTLPYRYANGSGALGSGHLFSGLLAGAYIIHVADTNGCLFDTSVTVTQPSAVIPGIVITDPTCWGLSNGEVVTSGSGGTPGYTYSFNGGGYSTTSLYGGLHAGVDSVLVKDSHGCVADTVFTITQPDKIVFTTINSTNISCFNGSDGIITINGNGAIPPYMYGLDALPWQVSNTFTGINAGMHYVKIKDSHNCEADTNITLTQPTRLVIDALDSLNPTCPGYTDGKVKILASGGTSPYTFSDNSATYVTSSIFNNLSAGAYTFSVKDANGCITDTTITLTGIPQIVVDSATITTPLCYQDKNGAISIGASGGAPPLYYKLGAAGNKTLTGVYTNLSAGTYVITISDSRNCHIDTSLLINQPEAISIKDSVTDNLCDGNLIIGAIEIEVTGGTAPYAYAWSNDTTLNSLINRELANGRYTVFVKDANNCKASLTDTVGYADCCTTWLPNAFTPNDDGKNDIFRFVYKGDILIITFIIENRFGEKVFMMENTNDLSYGWNGKYKGVDAEMGVYYYYAKIKCGNRGTHQQVLKGDVTLIR